MTYKSQLLYMILNVPHIPKFHAHDIHLIFPKKTQSTIENRRLLQLFPTTVQLHKDQGLSSSLSSAASKM